MLGLIAIQSYWISNSYKIKEKNFNYQVNKALSSVIKQLETQETIFEISNEFIKLTENKDSLVESSIYKFKQRDHQQQEDLEAVSSKSAVVLGGAIENVDSNLVISNAKDSLEEQKAGLIPIPTDNIKSILRNKVDNKTLFVEKIVNKLSNYNENILQRIEKVDLKQIIQKSLKNQDIEIEFEFAIKDKGKRLCASSDFTRTSSKIYSKKLYPNEPFHEEYYLELYIPQRTSSIVYSMMPVIIISMILTLLIVGTVFFIFHIILKQKQLSEIKNDFVNNLTHELKTPIATISLAGQMLSDKDIQATTSNIDRYAKVIKEESGRLTKQVEKVLQIALIDKGELKLKDRKIELNQFIRKIGETFVLKAENEGGKIHFNLATDDLYINADELHLTNVITNLIDNAIKYKKEAPKITIQTGQNTDKVFFSIEDNGIGISKNDQQRIFDRFYRVESGNVHNIKGFGLGLSYVKKIIDIYKGNIEIKSKLRHGTCFTIYLPKSDNNN